MKKNEYQEPESLKLFVWKMYKYKRNRGCEIKQPNDLQYATTM